MRPSTGPLQLLVVAPAWTARVAPSIGHSHPSGIEPRSSWWESLRNNFPACAISLLFRNSTGVTFTEYLTRVRIERVKELLANPNLRISEIAFQAGFQSLTHFNRTFLKLTGESPTEFRQRFRAIETV